MSFDYFDKVYCISLPGQGRRDRMRERFAGVGITNYEFVYAQEPVEGLKMSNLRRNHRGELGANLSHALAVFKSLMDGAQSPLFFEDDVVFTQGAEYFLARAMEELPPSWSMLYMGGHPRSEYTIHSKHLARVGEWSFAEAYGFSCPKSAEYFLYSWFNDMGQHDAMYDFILGRYAAAFCSFCTMPLLTSQPDGTYSHIGGKVDNGKEALVKRGWENNLCR